MTLTGIIFLFLFIAGFVIALTKQPFIAVPLYQMVYFASPTTRWWGATLPDLKYPLLASALLLICAVMKGKLFKKETWALPQFKYIWLHLLLLVLIFPIALNPVVHEKILVEFAKLCLLIICACALIHTKKELFISIGMVVLGSFYIGWMARGTGRNSDGRIEGIGPVDALDANDTAAILAITIPLIIVCLSTTPMYFRIISAGIGAWIINALILINSRGAFLASLAGSLFVLVKLILTKQLSAGAKVLTVATVATAIIGAYSLTDSLFWERMGTLQALDDTGDSGSSRTAYWLASVKFAIDYPFGGGASGFNALSSYYIGRVEGAVEVTSKSVHSTWFQALSETGWLGLAFYLMLILCSIKCNRRVALQALKDNNNLLYWLAIGIQGALISYLVASTFINRYHAEILYWLFLYSACLVKLSNQHISRD